MKNILSYFLKLLLFFLLLFFTERMVFLLFQFHSLKGISFFEILLVFRHAFAMDVASASVVLVIAFLFLGIYLFLQKKIILRLNRYYINLLIVLTGFVNTCDIALYQEWGTRINGKAISYLAFPKEAAASAWSLQFILVLLVFIVQTIVFIRLFKNKFSDEISVRANPVWKIVFILLMPGIFLVAIRGGFQRYPLDKSWAYFSRHAVLNQSAVNSSWNFIHAVIDPVEIRSNPYTYFPAADANRLVNEVHRNSSGSAASVLKTDRPNIVLIMVESLSSDVIEDLGGRKGITPRFSELVKEGLLFTRFYTPGFRTEQGLAALVSGFPSQPTTTIIRQFGKFDQLPGLPRSLDSAGYTSSYYYAGNLHFAFTKSYLQAMGFDKIIGEDDFIFKKRTAWGAYDEELFSFFNSDMKEAKNPFFSIIMTSTNHEPFDADVEKIVPVDPGNWCTGYINTVHYTDQCIGELIAGMKGQSWYDSTLIVIVSDHAHSCPEEHEYNSAPRHHIPFLLLGGALKEEYKGKTNDRLASQVDFAATILSMLHLDHSRFHWSKNILDTSTPEFVFYSFDDGFGWMNNRQQLAYDHKLKQVISVRDSTISAGEDSAYVSHGKAYLQVLMDEYIRFNEK